MRKRVFCTLLTCILLLSGCGTTLETSDSQQKAGGAEAGTEAESTAETESESEDRTEAGDSESGSSSQSTSGNAESDTIQDNLDSLSVYYLSYGIYDWEDAMFSDDETNAIEESGLSADGSVTIFSVAIVGETYETQPNFTTEFIGSTHVYCQGEDVTKTAHYVAYTTNTIYSDLYGDAARIILFAYPGEWEMSDFTVDVKYGLSKTTEEKMFEIETDKIGDFSILETEDTEDSKPSVVLLNGRHYLFVTRGERVGSGWSTYEDWDAYFGRYEYVFVPLEGGLVSDITEDDITVNLSFDTDLLEHEDRYMYVCHSDNSNQKLTITATYFFVYTSEEKANDFYDLLEDEWDEYEIYNHYTFTISSDDGKATTLNAYVKD